MRGLGKAATIQVEVIPLAETDEELARWLQAEELSAEEAHQGRDVDTEVVMEVAGLLT